MNIVAEKKTFNNDPSQVQKNNSNGQFSFKNDTYFSQAKSPRNTEQLLNNANAQPFIRSVNTCSISSFAKENIREDDELSFGTSSTQHSSQCLPNIPINCPMCVRKNSNVEIAEEDLMSEEEN
jgi:hypothetical protein